MTFCDIITLKRTKNMSIKNELKQKLTEFLNGKIGEVELQKWAESCFTKNKDKAPDKRDEALFHDIFMDLLVVDEPEWCDLTPEKLKYFIDCLSGLEVYDVERAMKLNKGYIEKL